MEAALLVHGLTGTPEELRPLADALARELHWRTFAPLLPGHGTTVADLARTKMEDWVASVDKSADELLSTSPKIHVLGLSMGAALALELFRGRPGKIASLVLLAPAIWLRSRWETFWIHLLTAIPWPKSLLIWRKRRPVTPGWVGYDFYSVRAAREWLRLADRARSFPPNDTVPALVIYSESDETVHPKSARFLQKRLSHPKSKCIALPRAQHVLTLSEERARVVAEVVSFYRGITSPS